MFLICGLGNPGKKYINTRHNIGFIVIDKLLTENNFVKIKIDKTKEIYKGFVGKQECILLKPLKYMNLSGEVVFKTLKYYKIKKQNLYIIHDDLDLINSKIKIKIGGGNAGHNGLSSIDKYLGANYNRIRIGIGRPDKKYLVTNYVLEKFSKDQKIEINNKIEKLCKYFELIILNKSLFLTKVTEN